MLKRIILMLLGVAAAIGLLGSLTLWAALCVWLPTKGKAWLIQEIERRAPVDLTIGSMRYHPLQGLILEDVGVADRATREIVGELPSLRVHVDWLALLVGRDLAFHGRAVIARPFQTRGTVSGRCHLRDHSLSLDAQTTDLPVPSIAAPIRRFLPPSLTDGVLRLRLHVEQPAQSRPLIAGRVEGARLVWTGPSWTLRGDATLEGSVTPTAAGAPFVFEGDAALRHATLEANALAASISDLNGTAKIRADRIEITSLTGTALDSRWTLEGAVTTGPIPSFEVLLSSHANLASLAAALPSLTQPWQLQGPAQVRAVCRGSVPPRPLDCVAKAEVRHAALAGPALASPLTEIDGHVRYDALTNELTIDRLTGRFMKESWTVEGAARLSDPVQLALHLTGTVPLDALRPWLSTDNLPTTLGGSAQLDLAINGSSRAPAYAGRIELREATAQWSAPSLTIQHATGSVRLSRDRMEIPSATLTANGEPLSLQADLSLAQTPRLVATVGFRRGQLRCASRVTPEEILIDQGELALEKSRVEIRGRLARKADQPSALNLSGTVELSELQDLPFFPLRAFADWHLEGSSIVETQFLGRLSDWSTATVQSRLRADRLKVREIPLEQITATLEQHGGVLRLRIPSGWCAQGQCWGELVIQREPNQTRRFRLEADVVSLSLARLAQAIPAWRARSVTGAASAHVMGFGAWEERQSWRAEGWLNATGERLGDVPLLDKLFGRLFGVLGDRLGLESLRRAQITQASLRWQLSKERFSTEDLRVGGLAGTEPIAIYAKGSIGLDQTLEVVIEPEFSEGVILQAPTTSTLAATVLKAAGRLERLRRLIGRHRITGTLEHPEYRFEFTTQEIFKQLAPAPGDLLENLLDAVRPR